jgi:cobalt-zinc-cadmium efflux system membrane fusion protein
MKAVEVKDQEETVTEVQADRSAEAPPPVQRKFSSLLVIVAVAITVIVLGAVKAILLYRSTQPSGSVEAASATELNKPDSGSLRIDQSQMKNIKLETVSMQTFRAEKTATGKIAFNEEVVTPVFSPFTGRIVRLIAKPGDVIKRGSPLFEIDTPDLVQAETDLLTAITTVAKAKTTLELAKRTEDRQHRLYLNKAVSLKDWEQAEADVKHAENDLRSAEAALASARDRLRVFGKSDAEIAAIEKDRKIDRITKVLSPISGTITSRKVGPGQYVKPDSSDPLFTIANLSTMWMLANVYESDVPLIKVGQPVEVRVLAYPNEVFKARISYISPAVDPATHRVAVRCVVENHGQKLKPDMFASFRIITNSEVQSLAVPTSAIVREGEKTSVWVKQGEHFVRREVTVGLEQNGYVQILSGLQAGEKIVSEGGLFLSSLADSK